jgi:hypothetical protein
MSERRATFAESAPPVVSDQLAVGFQVLVEKFAMPIANVGAPRVRAADEIFDLMTASTALSQPCHFSCTQ